MGELRVNNGILLGLTKNTRATVTVATAADPMAIPTIAGIGKDPFVAGSG